MRRLALLGSIVIITLLPAGPAAAAGGPPTPRLNGVLLGHPTAPAGRIGAAHAYSIRVDRGLIPGRRAYGVNEIPITVQDQQDPVWCVPAATRAVLSAFVKSLPTQAYIALLEGSNYLGTYLDRVTAVLNHYQKRIAYEVRNTPNLTQYREQIRTDIDVNRAPLIIAIDPAAAPWYSSLHLRSSNHAVVVNGYAFTPRYGGIVIWDPAGLPESGSHVVDVYRLWLAAVGLGAPVVW